ncbi:MAG: hypothetical protein M0004_03140 [Actinomycetota bacterium]|nr:hypothetical protein [Actinomycetota bacterium]
MSSTAVELWVGLMVAAMVIYMVAYTLLRTSGDGRPWYVRLRHPTAGGEREAAPAPEAAPEAGAPSKEPAPTGDGARGASEAERPAAREAAHSR